MAKYSSDFLNILDERGFIHQCSDFAGLDALASRLRVSTVGCSDYAALRARIQARLEQAEPVVGSPPLLSH